MTRKQKKMLIRIIICALSLVLLNLLPLHELVRFLLFIAVYILIGFDILRKAFLGIIRGQVFSESFLMAIATIGAFALAIYTGSGDYNEAVAVMLFYQIGELFQSCAVGRSRRNIAALMDIRPDYANIETDGEIHRVDPDEVSVGTVITVQPGERIPIDGVIVSGCSSLDTSALTGESRPRKAAEGDEVISGSVCMSGILKIRTTKEFGQSTVSRILELTENASSRKSRSEAFISRFARVYTPVVCILAAALAVLPPVVMLLLGEKADFSSWIYRALTFLVISCPCALVISVPLTFFAGIGGAGHEGILIKGSNYLEALADTKCVVFDKTGTLTKGVFEVSAFHHNVIDEEKLLEYAAHAECASSHPIAQSLIRAYGKNPDRSRVSALEEISGCGITAMVDSDSIAIGNDKLMTRLGIEYSDCHSEGTIIHIAVNGNYAGHIVISDIIKPGAGQAISALRQTGVKKTVMLSGDIKKSAEAVAEKLGIDEVRSELLPSDKVTELERLLSTNKSGKTAYVGDGINDAPVLTRADIGIAMGAMGSDAAIEAADVVLMDDDPGKLSLAIRIARRCIRIVRQNIVFSLAVKIICLALGALGIANMWTAIFADVGVMVIAVLNAVRALRTR